MRRVLLGWACPVCDEPGFVPCESCRADMREAPPLGTPPGLDHCLALLRYEGAARELVARIKYRNQRAAVQWLATGMAALIDETVLDSVDALTWAPATPAHVRRRGFDHGELLARAVAARLHREARPLLLRTRGPGLTGQAAADRRHAGVQLAVPRDTTGPASVILVDDVITTGTTMTAAADALRASGTTTIVGLAAARTPPPRRRGEVA